MVELERISDLWSKLGEKKFSKNDFNRAKAKTQINVSTFNSQKDVEVFGKCSSLLQELVEIDAEAKQ